jgi:hypothetical protein
MSVFAPKTETPRLNATIPVFYAGTVDPTGIGPIIIVPASITATSIASTKTALPTGRVPTKTSTATKTPTSTPTPRLGSGFRIVIAVQKDDSLFMMNQGALDLPLNFIQLGAGPGKILGEQWKVELLKPGQCVTVWKNEGIPLPPRSIECETVGVQLKRSGPDRFWKSEFNVYYHDLLVGTCKKDQATCEISFESTP